MNWAWSQGVVIVAAAGNSSNDSSGAPANCDNVISVASTTSTDARSSFSNYGTKVDVAAPGSNIVSTVRTGGYATFNGTSMASPHVAALAGLIWSQNPGATAQSVVDRIRTTADPIAGTGTSWAWGRINAAAAVSGGALPPAPSTATSVPTSTPTTVPTATSTPTATAVPTTVPTQAPPSESPCSPRPRFQISTAGPGPTSFTVTVRAGRGAIREIAFRELRNAAVSIGGQSATSSPFIYQPNGSDSGISFSVSRLVASDPWTVTLAATDDCGVWTTFVGGGTNTGSR
jgi:hypothetical protein